jgi:hypothetical protein
MSRTEIVPPRPPEATRPSWGIAAIAFVLGAAAFVYFDSGRPWLAVGAAIPAVIVGVLAAKHLLKPLVIYLGR